MADILREQFEFLMSFHVEGCPVQDCEDCLRMKWIKRLLLEPMK